jgi:hypothetical protein
LRTAQRRRREPFLENPGKTDSDFEIFLEAPRAASFAVTIRVGSPQLSLPGHEQHDDREAVIQEFLDCVALVQENKEEALRARFEEMAGDSAKAYLANFKASMEQLRPDGDAVSLVGLTRTRDGQEQQFEIRSRPRDQRSKQNKKTETPVPIPPRTLVELGKSPDVGLVEIRGILRYADSIDNKREIRLETRVGPVTIRVPAGLMADIVRPYYDEEVIVIAEERGAVLELQSCRSSTDD